MSTSIEWCDEVWNPIVGCSRVSAGCDHCYAMSVAHRQMQAAHVGLTKVRPRDSRRPGVDWTGEVRTVPHRLDDPMHWRKPKRVFVNSMSDLFHEHVSCEFIAAVFKTMAIARRHTFLVLTKRPRQAMRFFDWASKRVPYFTETGAPWPLPNVHLGVSAENQATFDERVPLLLQCPAAVHWVSAEPLLGALDLAAVSPGRCDCEACSRTSVRCTASRSPLDWIVVGGESGPGARPCDVAWIRSIVAQCRDASVPVFVKQLGAVPYDYVQPSGAPDDAGDVVRLRLQDRKGGDPSEWPAGLHVRAYPEVRP